MLTLFPVPVKSCFIEAYGFYLVNFSSVNVQSDGHLISVEQSQCTHDISIMLQKDPNQIQNLALIPMVQMM